ncbi:MAG: ABC transporter ATP-binding protein [Cephaloticoccus sp.]|nr:ABC transporter ATP-binding protein [Cephaloticoccus sp.]
MPPPAIEVSGLSKRYVIEHESRHDNLRDTLHHTARKLWRRVRWGTSFEREEFWALRDVSFQVQPGEVLGVVGRNGAGKSTLLKILSRITEPTHGRIALHGRVASLLEVGTGFHPELSGRENIFLNGAILGMHRAEIRSKFDEIVAFAEVEKFLDTPVKRYSSGMYVRLAFAVAAHLEPEILIVDEVLAVGDVQFQKKCLGKMQDVARGQGRTVLFVSHRLEALRELCTHGVLLESGSVTQQGDIESVLNAYVNSMASGQTASPRRHIQEIEQPSSVQHGKSLNLTLTVRVPESAHEAHMRATIYSDSGQPLVGMGTHLQADYVPPEAGKTHRITLSIPTLPLSQGNYRFNVALCNGPAGDVVLDRLEDVAQFQVIGPSPFALGRWPDRGSLVLNQDWQHQALR